MFEVRVDGWNIVHMLILLSLDLVSAKSSGFPSFLDSSDHLVRSDLWMGPLLSWKLRLSLGFYQKIKMLAHNIFVLIGSHPSLSGQDLRHTSKKLLTE